MPLFININALEEEIEKGTLRCPVGSTNCVEIKDSNGIVTEVRITKRENFENDGYINIVKNVKKTNILGQYEVTFSVNGTGVNTITQRDRAYIYVIVDTSTTIEGTFGEVKKAAISFSEQMIANGFSVALNQFASNSKTRVSFSDNRAFVDSDFKTNDLGGRKSFLHKAMKDAYNALEPIDSDKKFIVLFGDGQYWYSNDSDWDLRGTSEDIIGYRGFLRGIGVRTFAIQFRIYTHNNSTRYSKCTNYGQTTYGTCSIHYMKQLVELNPNDYYFAENSDQYLEMFDDVADKIVEDAGSATTFDAILTDYVGNSFYFSDSYSPTKTFKFESITETLQTTDPFYIQIDEYADDGWHETNASFNLSYTTSEGEEKTITCNENPEVYWIQQKLEIKSCSGVATSDTIKMGDSDEYEYYEKVCYEGYLRDNKYYNGFSVGIKINNLPDGTIAFGIEGGLGFPANINISTNLMCQYKFDYEKFNEDYSEIVSNLNSTSDPKEIASLTKRRNSLDKILDNYVNLTKNDLENYIARFTDQSATIRVDYNDLESSDVLTFTDSSETNSNLSCQNVRNQTINGKSVIVNQTCYLSLSKSMQLPNSCLDMTTGEQINCSSSNTQISGGSNFYVNLKATGGKIYVNLENAGYSGLLNVKLEDCSYTASQMNITYRSIDLADPFNQNYGTNREIGKNYFNNKYNFVNIIKSDIWEQNYTYQYSLSKENVENIRHDTSEEGVSSYNGRNCYFNSSNKYVCEFTRSGLDGETTNLFSKVEIND